MSLLTVTHGLVGRTLRGVRPPAHTGMVASFLIVENPQGWGLSTSELISDGVVVLCQDKSSHPQRPITS